VPRDKYDRWTIRCRLRPMDGPLSRFARPGIPEVVNLPAGLRWIDVCCGSGVLPKLLFEHNSPIGILGGVLPIR